MTTMQEPMLDFAASDEQAGFRLHGFEVLNWGTFHEQVWCLESGGENVLVTGDIGSGKSTLVDAITTLLVPSQRITYNKAAGAEARERSLKSYVQGYYKTERDEEGLAARPKALRGDDSYSVILGRFCNRGFGLDVTLAQVFWIKDPQAQPARFFVVADRAMSIAADFSGFGSDILDLKKRLRNTASVEVFDTFPPYEHAFRRRFGIDNPQALELFSQTVSMKSVGNLTDFVRAHMLEPFPVDDRIEALTEHFDNLTRAHDAVVRARQQLEKLAPLVDDGRQHIELATEAAELRAARDALSGWFAGLKHDLLKTRREKLENRRLEHVQRVAKTDQQLGERQAEREALHQAIRDNGGDRLEQLSQEIAQNRRLRDERQDRSDRYARLAEPLELPPATDAALFVANRQAVTGKREALDAELAQCQNRITEQSVMLHELRRDHEEITEELTSLRQRRSNIPARVLALRERLCAALGLSEDALPFAGELIQVHEEERDWQGAAERLLHNFGLSLLVPDAQYPGVSDWVDQTQLRGRLVYYRVRPPRGSPPELHPRSLVRKLAIRPDSEFYPWLESELARRFDYACCASLADFRRERQAVTRAGQIKAGGDRHEKDDRHRIDDRARYVLGWSNADKMAALEKRQVDLETRMQAVSQQIASDQARQKQAGRLRETLGQLEMFSDFGELDWKTPAAEVERLEAERQRLQDSSNVLQTLQRQLTELENRLRETVRARDQARDELTTTRNKIETIEREIEEASLLAALVSESVRAEVHPRLERMRSEALAGQKLTVETCVNRERDMREWLQSRIDNAERRLTRLAEKVVRAMQSFCDDYPQETREMDPSLSSIPDFAAMLERLQSDDLPRFEARFRTLLRENTINEVANFQAQLNREREAIRERIGIINRSLFDIDYNDGRYIKLLAEPSPDVEIRDFQRDLRACTEHAVSGDEDEQYTESRFLRVRAIVERFKGREGTSEVDRRWTRKVTDVRNWFVFSASERWREDDVAFEHYTDSGGKSGGQKEKLAYTVLAASLAYQFGLEWGEQRSRSFRFVVIDEAFGRGSDDSARFGLRLFERLNLQLLIVTPLQKIHVIEPFVSAVGFVHNEGGMYSRLRNLTIEEYRDEKAARSGAGS
ncbi:MAG: ATP-binding protein [Halothiobacillaceae bacterium]